MKEIIIQLMNQLPQVLDGTQTQTQSIDTSFQIPEFKTPSNRFEPTYIFDELNNQIRSYIQELGYQTPAQVIDLPKVPGPDLVLDTKALYELNKTDDYKSFVNQLFSKIVSNSTTLPCPFELQGIFINYRISSEDLKKHIAQLLENPETYGTINYPEYSGKKLMMEYSSPNMAKSMSIGHFRNTIIGQIMYNIIQQTGCPHMGWNYLGDWGTAFGKFIVSLHYHYQQDPSIVEQILNNPESMMGVVYGKFKEIEVDEKENKARKIVELLEAGNQIIVQLRLGIRELSLMDFETVYRVLNIHFDSTLGESFSANINNNVLDDLKAHDLVHESQGALIIKIKRTTEGRKPLKSSELDTREDGKDQVVLFAKSDGSSLYAPRDLALLKWRTQVLGAEKLVYVVGSEQSVYFEHLIALGKALGYIQDNQMMHLGYGLYLQNGKKMASRSGGAYRIMELIDEITDAILAQFEDRLDRDTAQKLAVSALIINDTKGDISKDVNLDIPSMTKLNGDTGVYVQYTAVRMRSLLEKLGTVGTHFNTSVISELGIDESFYDHLNREEKALLFQTSLLPYKIKQSLDLHKPHILTQYLLDLAAKFNKRYNDSPKVLEMDENKKYAVRLLLESYRIVFEKTMTLLHMPKVERM